MIRCARALRAWVAGAPFDIYAVFGTEHCGACAITDYYANFLI